MDLSGKQSELQGDCGREGGGREERESLQCEHFKVYAPNQFSR